MEENGHAQNHGSPSPGSIKLDEVAPKTEPGRTLDPTVIGRRVEQEVAALLEAARGDADRKALACVRMVETELTALQRAFQEQIAKTLAQLAGLAERVQPTRAAEHRSLAERFDRSETPART
jgi:hypothetical protein